MGYGTFSTFGRTRAGALKNLSALHVKFCIEIGYVCTMSGLYARLLTEGELDCCAYNGQRPKDLWIAGAHFDK